MTGPESHPVSPAVQRAIQRLNALHQAGLQRQRRQRSSAAGRQVTVQGRPCVNFCSNDYLGLTTHPVLLDAATCAMHTHGSGSSGSALVTGYSQPLAELEERLAAWTGREAAVVFSSGYLANLALAQVFCETGQMVLEDRLNHASLIDSARLAGCRLRRYRHADASNLQQLVARMGSDGIGLVCSDAVFSMDGDIAPLPSLAAVCAQNGLLLAVDDAHGIGLFGPQGSNQGQGSVMAAGLREDQVPLLCGTLGKALAAAGAFIAGPKPLVDLVIQTARTYLFNTALPPAVAATALAAINLCQQQDERTRLFANIAAFRQLANEKYLPLTAVNGPIQPIVVGDEKEAVRMEQSLLEQGMFVRAMRYPTVARGQARLRVTITAAHQQQDLERLATVLAELWKQNRENTHA